MLPIVELKDLIELQGNKPVTHKEIVQIRGCNGAGKSTIPFSFLYSDPDAFEIAWRVSGKGKSTALRENIVATVFPNYEWMAIGKYRTKCGGMDSFNENADSMRAVELLWNLDYNIMMEGVIASSVRQSYIDLFNRCLENNQLQRKVTMFNLTIPLEVCLQRIQLRNGGKPINEEYVENKWKTIGRNVEKFAQAGFNSIRADNSTIAKEDTVDWFFKTLGMDNPYPQLVSQGTELKTVIEPCSTPDEVTCMVESDDSMKEDKDKMVKKLSSCIEYEEEMYLPTKDDLEGYEWAQYYKAPDESVVINWKHLKTFWYWINERMKIYKKRMIDREPFPWTEDKILSNNKFTNAIRDLDKGTVYYIKNILMKMDEPNVDLVKRTKEVILNTMVYRLFIRKETMDRVGWLSLDNWETDWENAKRELRAIKASGQPVFHGAYYVFTLSQANPNPATNKDKTENAICLIEIYKKELDKVYDYVTTHSMKDCLGYLTYLPCTGLFTIYEWLCDWGMAGRYVKNTIVDWNDDSYVNIGPGNKRGLDFIFVDRGNLSYEECDFYLRASWRHYMNRYGYYDEFLSNMPANMNNDINLRIIEHDLCELQKYLCVSYGIGKTKGNFKNSSKDCLDDIML